MMLAATNGAAVAIDGAGALEAFIISLVAGAALWAVVPRGVVLTKSTQDPNGGTRPNDTWWLTNDSSVPARITDMSLTAIGDAVDAMPHVRFIDHSLAMRMEMAESWDGVVVPPGESIRAHVEVNHTLHVRYRREGLTGFLERREIEIHGYA